jgi:WD40 repeat protein
MTPKYDMSRIRTLLTEGFSDEELRALCFDLPEFKPVYHQLAQNSGKSEIVSRLLEYAERTHQLAKLLELAKAHNPTKYAEAEPYAYDDAARQSPYRGLQYFDVGDADLFFGRELLTAKLVGRLLSRGAGEQGSRGDVTLAPLLPISPARFLAVVGASGSGKSSVVRAGLVPALQGAEGSSHWLIHIITPTAHPLEALAASLTRDSESVTATTTLIDDMSRESRSLHVFVRKLLAQAPTPSPALPLRGGGRFLLIVDQFEELFTLCRHEDERRAFVDNLLTAVDPETAGPTLVVLTLRADFYAHCAQYDNLREALARQQEYIGPMSLEELRQAIELPAQRAGYEFEPGLIELILRDVGDEPGALPLLSHALLETWRRRQGRLLTLAGYDDAGGVRRAIARTADIVFNQHLTPEQQPIARNIFLRLTELGEGAQDTRRRATLAELSPRPEEQAIIEPVLQILVAARLVTTDQGTAEVAHEALIREWPALRQWLNDNREELRLHRQLSEAMKEWQRLNRDPGMLYRGAKLAQAGEWAEQQVTELNALEWEFLTTSKQAEENERLRELEQARALAEEQQRRAEAERQRAEEQQQAAVNLRKRALIATGVGVIAVIFAIVAIWLGAQSNQNAARAEQEAYRATSRGLAVASIDNFDKDINRSLLLAMYAISESYTIEAGKALQQALQASRLQLTLSGHNGPVYDVAFNPDGTRLITTGADGLIKVWDIVTGRELQTLSGHTGIVYGAAFNSEGTVLATAGEDRTVRLWNISSGQEIRILKGHTDEVLDVTFSPDGTRLATASQDKTVKIWNISSGQAILTLTEHTSRTRSIDFSPDGIHLATASDDGTAKIWDITSGKKLLTLFGHEGPINDVEFSISSKRLATASDDGTAIIWDASSGQKLGILSDTSPIYGVGFKYPTGRYLVTSNFNGEVKLWDIDSLRRELINFSYELASNSAEMKDNWVYRVKFSPDGTQVASASRDGKVKVWSVFGEGALVLSGHTDRVRDVNFSPDGQRLATASWDKTGRIWDAKSGQELFTLKGHDGVLVHIAFSPDGTRLVTASADETAKVWDANTGKELFTLRKHPYGVQDVTFSPDGKSIVTTNLSGTVKIWDTISGAEIFTLPAHDKSIERAVFSPDGQRLATASSDKTVKVWDTKTWELKLTLKGHTDTVDGVIFSPDGQLLATASWDNTAKIWNAASGEEILTLAGHTQPLNDIIFSPDGTRLATASADTTVKIWDTISGEEILTLFGHLAGVNELAFSPDQKSLATAGNDGVVFVYPLDLENLMNLARSHLKRPLKSEECLKYLHQNSCPPIP